MLTLLLPILIASIAAFLVFFVLIPYQKISSYKREGITTFFYPIIGYYKLLRHYQNTKDDIMGYSKSVDTQTSKVLVTNVARTPTFILRDPNYIQDFIHKQELYEKGNIMKTVRYLIGTGLVGAEGETWRRHRRIISSNFHFEFLKNHIPVIHKTVTDILDKVSPDQYKGYLAISRIQEISGELIGRIFFGESMNKVRYEGKMLTRGLSDMMPELSMCAKTPLVLYFGPKVMKIPFFPRYRKILERVKVFRQTCLDIVKERKAHPEDKHDLLACLLLTQKQNDPEMSFTDEEIVDEFITFFLAGMDSTSHLSGMSLYNLTRYPQYLPILEEERKNIYNKNPIPTSDALHRMEVLQCVMKETLRFHGPSPIMFGRVALYDHEILDLKIQKGTLIICEFLAAAFDEKYEKNAHKFDPGRWKDQSVARHPYSFIPFSAGTRNCIGQHLAMIATKIILSEFLERFDFTLEEGYKLQMTLRSVYEPVTDVPLNLEKKVK